MNKKKFTYKEVFLIIFYFLAIIIYKSLSHYSVLPENSLVGIFLFFLVVTTITLIYLLIIQKETLSSLIYNVKIFLPYLAIPFVIGFLIIVTLPFFIQTESRLFKMLIILILFGIAILCIVIKQKLSKSNNNKESANKHQ